MVKPTIQVTKTPRQHLVPPSEARANKTSKRKSSSENKRLAVELAKEAKRAELNRKQREAEERRNKKKREDAAKRTG